MPADKPKAKSSKPLMEKRRRARINDSLMQLKTLVLDALNKNNSRHSKLEKADILEMTVRYLRTIQRQQISASVNSDPAVLGQYRSGYAQCMNEVTRYLGTNGGAADGAPELRTRLVGHLADMCTTSQQQGPRPVASSMSQQQRSPLTFQIAPAAYRQPSQQAGVVRSDVPIEGAMVNIASSMQVITHLQQQQPGVTSVPVQHIAPTPEGARTEYSLATSAPIVQTSPAAVRAVQPSQNSAQVVQSVPVGTLPSGEITVVLPQEALPNGQVPTHFIPVYAPAGSAAVLTPNSFTNTNIPLSATPNVCHVSVSSPRAASTVPCTMSPTSPRSTMTIPAQHAQVTAQVTRSSSAVSQAQLAYCVPVQTKLSPTVREFHQDHHQPHQPIESARGQNMPYAAGQCVAKSDPMWRPW